MGIHNLGIHNLGIHTSCLILSISAQIKFTKDREGNSKQGAKRV